MRNGRKKKTPITLTKGHHPSADGSSSPYATRSLIRRFHVLLKKHRQLQKNGSSVPNIKEWGDVEQEMERLGGLAAYQRMSSIGQGVDRGGGSEKVFIKWLVGMGLSKRGDKGSLRCANRPQCTESPCDSFSLLEVGALKPDNYASCSSWITTTAIDLRSRHPSILELDFLTMNDNDHAERWDLISLSLVVNFEPNPKHRGHSISIACLAALDGVGRTNAHVGTYIPASVWIAISRCKSSCSGCCLTQRGQQLPSACVENSHYMSFERLEALMAAIGFVKVEKKWRRGRKMAYWLYRKTVQGDRDEFRKKRACRAGKRNNFCILL